MPFSIMQEYHADQNVQTMKTDFQSAPIVFRMQVNSINHFWTGILDNSQDWYSTLDPNRTQNLVQ